MEGKSTTTMMIMYEIVTVERDCYYILVTITHTQTIHVYLLFFLLPPPNLHTNIYNNRDYGTHYIWPTRHRYKIGYRKYLLN